MAWPVDGRRELPTEALEAPYSEEEFQELLIETVVQTSLQMFAGYAFPEGLSEAEARKFHGTFLANFSFFAWKFPSWLMNIAAACPFQDVRRSIIEDCVDEEVGDVDANGRCHIDVLYDEAEACGISREEVYATEPTPVLIACINALENFSRALGWDVGLAALGGLEVLSSKPAVDRRTEILRSFLTPEQIEQARSSRDAMALAKRTGLTAEQVMFAALHEYKDQEHGGGSLSALVKYGRTRDVQERMLWAIKAGMEVFGVMREEINRIACAAVNLNPDGTPKAVVA